ncbi:hypothetical protein BG015_003819 [Linnemannia schmuckeri]|uniref:Transmembrane protein n=1 Tax=Linnemannia schmuckeri TaxID=64567 RepID=A0A9P5RJF7_9FUNG|nr:hypothetical protein BG015_003819 [Linnemannia schmuckeri]
MFTSLPFVCVSLFFTLFGFLLIGALDALLALYSTSKAEYASSIRWSQQGGYLEMFRILRNSFRHVPRKATATMIIIIVASIVAPFASVGLGRMVHQVDIETNPGSTLSQTSQILLDALVSRGWTQFLARSTTMEDALKTMLANPQYIVDMDPGKQYTPKTYDYKVDCNKFNTAIVQNITTAILDPKAALDQPNDGCAIIGFDIINVYFEWALANTTNQRISDGLHKAVAPGTFADDTFMDVAPAVFFSDSRSCYSPVDVRSFYKDTPRSGMTFSPSTMIFRCRYPTGEMQVAASTSFTFSVRHVEDFANVTSAIFDNTTDLPLLNIMDTLTRNGTFASLTNNATMVILTDTSGAMVHYLSCVSRWVTKGSDLSLLCQYIVVDAFSTTTHPGDPAIAAIARNKPVPLSNDMSKMVMRHVASSSTSTGMTVYSVSSILNATSAATRYLASLGPNLVMDVENQKLTILYNTVEIQSVTEIPTVLFWVMVTVMTACTLLMAYSMIKIDTIHSGTLYMVIYEKLVQKNEPALMYCNFEPLAFDGMQIIAEGSNKPKKSEA